MQRDVTFWRKKNIGATACCAWPRAETFNGLQKVLKMCISHIPKPSELISDQVNLDERTKKKGEKLKFEKNENCKFLSEKCRRDDENFDSTRTSLHLCITLWGRMVFVSTFTSEKNQLEFGKKWKILKFFLHPLICPIIPERKNVDVIFTFKHSLLNPRTNYETMDSVFVLGPDIQDTDRQARVKKNWETFFKKIKNF